VNEFYFPFAKYRYRLHMPAVPVKNIFCIWKIISWSVRFYLFIVSVIRVATSMATDGVNAFILSLLICLAEWSCCLVCLNRSDRFCKL
jgi:hypothetical protein